MSQRVYRFCPLCGKPLEARWVFQRERPTCVACGFVYFHDPKVAVIGLVTWRNRVLLIRRGVEPMKGKWSLPGGFMDAGEMPAQALMRELREEVGLAVDVKQLVEIFPMAGPGVINQGIVLAYAVEADADEQPLLVSDDDVVDAGWFTADELPSELAFESTQALVAGWLDAAQTG
jgi:ADP-ribose pyrophosphatase YjhB (NUDIX family)